MTECSDASVKAESLGQDIFDLLRGDRLQIAIVCALSDDDNRLALAFFAVLRGSAARTVRKGSMEEKKI